MDQDGGGKRQAFGAAAQGDLREFLRQAEAEGELVRVQGADPDCELGALIELSHEHLYPPVLLFEDIKGVSSDFRMLSNVRTARFVVGELSLEALKSFRKAPKQRRAPIPPREVNSGPVLDHVEEGEAVDLGKFPAPLWHAEDGGRYIGTECINITKDPDSDWVNVGTYRVMVHDRNTLGIFIEPGKDADTIRKKYWARGLACPMAVAVGQAPVLGMVAANAVGAGVSEYGLAGGRLGRPIDVVRGRKTDLPIPADAELVFEGFMPPPETEARPEGPFGEWPGYYASGARAEPVLKVEAVYWRDKPLIIGQPPTAPTYPGRQIKLPRLAALWDQLEGAGVPGITGVWMLPGFGSMFNAVIAVKQLHAGHAKMAGLVAAGCAQAGYMNRLIVVVDEDIDITDASEVMWAIATRWDPATQTDVIDGCYTGHIDPLLSPAKRAAHDITNSRMIIYAVRPWAWKDQFPKVNMVDRAYADAVRQKWQGQLEFLQRPAPRPR